MALNIPGYRVIRKINSGGMSTVYLAIQISVGRIVALKVMNPQLNADSSFNERFQREANIVGQLSHPNIIAIYDIGQQDNLNYIAMDYLPNGTLHDKMAKGISSEEALRITRELASALDHIHEKNYVHRDIKPENILFRADNSAVLSDFGVARGLAVSSRMTHVGTVVGTPHYMSPEQTKGKEVDGRSDLYSLGVVLFEMLTGTVPYQGDEAVTIALKHLSAPIPKLPIQYLIYQKIIDKLLAKDPDQRFQRGRDLITAIENLEKQTNPITNTTITHPTDMTVITLFTALISATHSALRWRWNKLRNARWNPERGFYFRHPTKATEIFFNDMHEAQMNVHAEDRELIETQVHKAIQQRQRMGTSLLLIVLALATIGGSYYLLKQNKIETEKQLAATQQSSASASSALTTFAPVENTATATASAAAITEQNTSVTEEEVAPIAAQVSSEPEEPPTYALRITPDPSNARIRILNIREKYSPGMQLAAGRYHLEIKAKGYDTYKNWIEIIDQDLKLNIPLKMHISAGTEISTPITARIKSDGPDMISIPPGSFFMGDKNTPNAMPIHKVTINKTFAISKFEITFDDYDIFAQATKLPLPDDNRWGRGDHPVINVSYNDAKAYAEWLSKTSGKKYRLATEAEWEYVARANTKTLFWWGDEAKDASGRANCRRGCSSKYSGLFGAKTAPVGTYPANGFGVYDTSGNVAEWVQDCYSDNYSLHPSNGQAYETNNCPTRAIRGGSAKSNSDELANALRTSAKPDESNEHLGFRVVMEL